ncbi:MAG: putative transporter permease protein [Thermomicrobiales bacterium]|nr:putative transporter permease protein [Thermomicrobiales bacterium]
MGESTIGIPVRDEPPQSGFRSLLRRVGQVDEIGVIGALIVLIVLLALLVPDTFLTAQNFINVSRQASYVGIMAVGMVFVIAMGDIDLSVGSIWMLSSVMMAIALRDGYSIWIAVAVCMLVATLCGLLNGALSVALGIPTIIVTLGTLSLFRGLGLVVTEASPVSGYDLKTWFCGVGPVQSDGFRTESAGHRQQPAGCAVLRYPHCANSHPRHDPHGVHRGNRRGGGTGL